jgi:cytochrome c oxidase cbb3-type subunit 3
MSEQKPNKNSEPVMDHEYDGIKELDHPLPYWWTASFFLTVLFGIPYFILYVWGGAPSLADEHAMKMQKIKEMRSQLASNNVAFVQEEYLNHDNEEGHLAGKAVYEENCLSCHADNGKGDIGPNMTDKFWIKAKGTPETIYQVAYTGIEENGMPPWGEILSKEDIYKVVSYLMTLKNTNVADGKEPQGEAVED